MQQHLLSLRILEGHYGVVRLGASEPTPAWADDSQFLSVTRTLEELSVVCGQERIPESVTAERDWRLLKIDAVLDFSQIGILAAVSRALAAAEISIFVLSTFDTDYILVKAGSLEQTVAVLEREGHRVVFGEPN